MMYHGHYNREPVLTADLAAEQAFDDAWTQYAAARRCERDIQAALAAYNAEPDGPNKDRLARRVTGNREEPPPDAGYGRNQA